MISLNGNQLDALPFRVNKIASDKETLYEINSAKPTRGDGEVIISFTRGVKVMVVTGIIEADSRLLVERYTDDLKLLADLHGEYIVISYADGYRAFAAHIEKVYVEPWADNENVTHRTFSLTFRIAEPPYGIECDADGDLITSTGLSLDDITDDVKVATATVSGTVAAKPRLKMTVDVKGDMTSFDIINRRTGQQISVTPPGLATGDVIVINTEEPAVRQNGDEIDFTGVPIEFELGDNQLEIDVYSSTGTILEASQTVSTSARNLFGSRKQAQSFTFSTSDLLNRLNLLLSKVGNPTGNITVRIETNSGGSPSGTLVAAAATITITPDEVNNIPSWISKTLPFIALTLSTTYWIVLSTVGGDVDNYFRWHCETSGLYANGSAKQYNGSWAALTGDNCFKAFKVTVDVNNGTIDTVTKTLDFTQTTDKDAGNTTANWDTAGGYVHMNGVTSTDQQQTTQNADELVGGAADVAAAQSFTVSSNKLLRQMQIYGKRSSAGTSAIRIALYNDNAGKPGSELTGVNVTGITNTSYAYITGALALDYQLTAGTTYWVVLTVTSGHLNWGYNSAGGYANGMGQFKYVGSGGNPDAWSGDLALDMTFKVDTITYVAAENAVTNALDSTDCDIISVSQVAQTILLGSPAPTYQGQISSDGGANYVDIARDLLAFDTETIPSVIASDLRFKGILTGTALKQAYLTNLSLYYRKGLMINATTRYAAQSFVPGSTGNRQRVDLYMAKVGTPGDITVRIETDTAGSPSGTLANVSATKTLTAADVATGFGWVSFNFPLAFSLTSGTTYWIVIKAAATVNDSNKYMIAANNGGYITGSSKKSTNSGGAWTAISTGEDLMFKTYATSGTAFRYDLAVEYEEKYL